MRIWDNVLRGEFDNSTPGRISGTLWLAGTGPIDIDLSGNCYRDLAGTRFSITNLHPHPDPEIKVQKIQQGLAGLCTASLKFRRRGDQISTHRDAPSYVQENRLYLEWYSNQDGRVVIESADFQIQVTPPLWVPTLEDELHQLERNQQAKQIWEQLEKDLAEADDDEPDDEDWDHPDASDKAIDEAYTDEAEWIYPNIADQVPRKGLKGTLWDEDLDGSIHHQAVIRIRNLLRELAGLTCQENDDEDVQAVIQLLEQLSMHMETFLDHLCFQDEEEPEFLAACLKRCLNKVNSLIQMSQRLAQTNLLPTQASTGLLRGLFVVREDVLAVIQEMRNQARDEPPAQD